MHQTALEAANCHRADGSNLVFLGAAPWESESCEWGISWHGSSGLDVWLLMMHAPEGRERTPLAEPPASSVTLTSLFRERGQDMLRLAYLLTGSREMAEDVVRDAFVSLEGRLSSVEVPAAYLRACVVNGARSGIRRQRTVDAY